MEEQGESHDRSIFLGENHLGGPLDKQGVTEDGFIRDNLIGTFLLLGQLPDEIQDDSGFIGPRGADLERVCHKSNQAAFFRCSQWSLSHSRTGSS